MNADSECLLRDLTNGYGVVNRCSICVINAENDFIFIVNRTIPLCRLFLNFLVVILKNVICLLLRLFRIHLLRDPLFQQYDLLKVVLVMYRPETLGHAGVRQLLLSAPGQKLGLKEEIVQIVLIDLSVHYVGEDWLLHSGFDLVVDFRHYLSHKHGLRSIIHGLKHNLL